MNLLKNPNLFFFCGGGGGGGNVSEFLYKESY